MLPILFGAGVLAVIVGVIRARAGAKVPSLPPASSPGQVVKVLPPEGVPQEVIDAAAAIQKGTASPEILAEGIEAAQEAGLEETAEKLAVQMDKLVNEVIPEIVRRPDRPASPIPLDPASKKTLWYKEKKGGVYVMMPRFRSVLVQFETLQETIGVNPDGRIGPATLSAFVKVTGDFQRAPRTIEALAANAVKWTEVLRRKIAVASVAGPFR